MTRTEQNEFPCTNCENADIERAWELMTADKEKNWVAVQISPAVRVAIGEWFGMSHGEDAIGKVVSVLKGIGADAVVDTAIAEDAVTLAETERLRARKKRGEKFPLLSSRCTAFLQFMQEKYPETEISEIPAPGAINASVLKETYRAQAGKKKMYVISVEPCKSAKASRNADLILTTEELVQILDETGVNLRVSRKSVLDMPFGMGAGGGYLCGKSGGSAESVARCLLADKSEEAVRRLSYSGLYGEKSRRTLTLDDGETEWKLVVVTGADEAERLLKDIQDGKTECDYAEITACVGGCICGDGQDCTACVGESETLRSTKLRAVALKVLDEKRAVKSADRSASVVAIGRLWETAQQRQALELLEEEARAAVEEATQSNVAETESLPHEEEILSRTITIGAENDSAEDEELEIEWITQEEFDAVGTEDITENIVETVEPEEVQPESLEDIAETVEPEEGQPEPLEEIAETVEPEEVQPESLEDIAETVEPEEGQPEPLEEIAETVEPEEVQPEPLKDIAETAEELVVTEDVSADTSTTASAAKPYYERLSGKDRRKMKRKNKGK